MALGLYTAIPGFAHWDESCQGWLAPALPAVGLLLGALWLGIASLLRELSPSLLGAAVVALALPLLTGFLHLDGFMDVSDALLSARPREEKLRILKDPHAGSFSVVAVVSLMLIQTGAADAVLYGAKSLSALLFLPIISRAMAGLMLMTQKPLSQSAYGRKSYESATPGMRLFCFACLTMALLLSFFFGLQAGISCAVAALAFVAACTVAIRQLGGMNGDIAGWSICCAEVCGLIALACL